MTINGSISFALDGSMIDLIHRQIPNFQSPSDRWLATVVDQSVQLYPVAAGHPPIARESSNLYLEPASINLVTNNIGIDDAEWIKGSDVDVDRDGQQGPTGQLLADEITFTGGDLSETAIASQTISKAVELEVGTDHVLSGYLALGGGSFATGTTNVIRVTGEVVDPASSVFYLSELNGKRGKYQYFEIPFKTTGAQIEDPPVDEDFQELSVNSVSGNQVVLQSSEMLAFGANIFAGGRLQLSNLDGSTSHTYNIVSHEGSTSNGAPFTVILDDGINLANDGVDNTWSAFVLEAEKVTVNIEAYSTSIAKLWWGGIFLEEREFPTSPIFQRDEIISREGVTLTYRDSPFAGSEAFCLLYDLAHWRGDGNLLKAGNVSLDIDSGQLVVIVGGVTMTTAMPESKAGERMSVLVQASTPLGFAKLYLNGVLIEHVSLTGFSGDLDAVMDLTSEGVREIRRLFIFDRVLLDGQISPSEMAQEEVLDVVFTDDILPNQVIASAAPEFVLPPVEIPSRSEPTAQSLITAVGSNSVDVISLNYSEEGEGGSFSVHGNYSIIRGILGQDHQVIATGLITAINTSAKTLTLSDVGGALTGDFILEGDITSPGKASVRFPYEPIDEQEIITIEASTGVEGGYWLTLAESSTSFKIGRSFVQSPEYQAIAEVSVEEIDATLSKVRVNHVDNVSVGDLIAQPKEGKEMILSPETFFVTLKNPVPGVVIGEDNGVYPNAVVLSNYAEKPVTAEVLVRVFI